MKLKKQIQELNTKPRLYLSKQDKKLLWMRKHYNKCYTRLSKNENYKWKMTDLI